MTTQVPRRQRTPDNLRAPLPPTEAPIADQGGIELNPSQRRTTAATGDHLGARLETDKSENRAYVRHENRLGTFCVILQMNKETKQTDGRTDTSEYITSWRR